MTGNNQRAIMQVSIYKIKHTSKTSFLKRILTIRQFFDRIIKVEIKSGGYENESKLAYYAE